MKRYLPLFVALPFAGLASAAAPHYPAHPITLVVPLPPGGASDNAARMLAEHLSAVWKQPVVVANKAGANGLIGAQAVANARPDGYTLLFAVPSIATFDAFLKTPPVKVDRDLAAVSLIVDKGYYVLVNANLPVKDIREFIAYAKRNPGKLNYGTFGGGAMLATEMFKQMAGIDVARVQYRGEALAATALAANEVQVVLGSFLAARNFVNAGKVRVLAGTTASRLASMPQLPTLSEAVPGYEARVWYGLMAPAGTPEAIRKKLADEVAAFVRRPEVARRFAELEYTPRSSSPEEFEALLAKESKLWNEVAARADIEKQ